MIAAGSTGSMPATAKLLAAIARLPRGAVVLPGLDTDLDEISWRAIAGSERDKIAPAPVHPQFAMRALLDRIGIARDAVKQLTPPAAHGRELLVSEILRPATTTDRWRRRFGTADFAATAEKAMADVRVIEAANAEDEALAIAVSLREAIERPDKPLPWSRPTVRWHAVSLRLWNAGKSRSTIPAAMRLLKRQPEFSRDSSRT